GPPFALQRGAALAIALLGNGEADNAVGAEIAEIPAQQAPGGNGLLALVKGQAHRPDGAAAGAALLVLIIDGDGLFLAHGKADVAQDRNGLALAPEGNRPERGVADAIAQILGRGGGDLGQGIARGGTQTVVGLGFHPAGAQYQRLELL